MNMNITKVVIVFVAGAVVGIGAYALILRTQKTPSTVAPTETSDIYISQTPDVSGAEVETPTAIPPLSLPGSLSTSTTGELVYTNEQYGFRFTVPPPFYRIGDDHLGAGTLQFFNFPEDDYGKGGPRPGKWKIEAGISDLAMFASTSAEGRDGDASKLISQDKEFVTIDGQEAVRVTEHYTLYNGVSYMYSIKLPHRSSTTLSISVGVPGEESPEVVQALDELIATFEWLES
ncbi:MAG: hypothetical protein KBD24_02805 [Candidatus Pacebacteria bacterium]|nr:hypothetical protein [Candidatus Paceibacterota bacterium]